jgi:predicted nucleic acid-binding protein
VTTVLVDTNALLDPATLDPTWEPWSRAALDAAKDSATLVINAIVYGELAVSYPTVGAHAAVAGYRLLTRDATRYRTCFPTLELIAPE